MPLGSATLNRSLNFTVVNLMQSQEASMKLSLKFVQRFLLFTAPLVTGSVFVALPGLAATHATSGSAVNLSNFSHNPVETSTFTDTNTLTITSIDSINSNSSALVPPAAAVTANADALATFPVNPSPALTEAFNVSLSAAQGDSQGESHSYLGLGQSFSQVVGYNFSIGANETFSFDVNAALGLQTSTEYVGETARAGGNISFLLFDTTGMTDPSKIDWNNPLEFITFSAQLDSSGQNYYTLGKSANLNFQPTNVAINASAGENQQSFFGSLQGTISRGFNKLTSLALVAFQGNQVSVSCKAP